MKSASNGGLLKGRLEVLHVFLITQLGANYITKSGINRHKSSIAVREATHHTGTAAMLPVQPFNYIVGTDTGPVFAGKIAAD